MNKVVVNNCYGGFSLSQKAIARLVELGWTDADTYSFSMRYPIRNESRHDPLLVQTVEELGEAASGDFAHLIVKEIEGNVYRIEEYDGMEAVITPAQMSWVTIGGV